MPLPAAQNATSIASRFRDLYGLELALKQELRELGRAQVGTLLQRWLAWEGPGLVQQWAEPSGWQVLPMHAQRQALLFQARVCLFELLRLLPRRL